MNKIYNSVFTILYVQFDFESEIKNILPGIRYLLPGTLIVI